MDSSRGSQAIAKPESDDGLGHVYIAHGTDMEQARKRVEQDAAAAMSKRAGGTVVAVIKESEATTRNVDAGRRAVQSGEIRMLWPIPADATIESGIVWSFPVTYNADAPIGK